MAEVPKTLRLDGEDHDLANASDAAKSFVVQLQQLEQLLHEKTNMVALLTKAKNAYIADLKAEVIKTRTGIDLSTLFDEE